MQRNLPQNVNLYFLHTTFANNLTVSKYQHGHSIMISINWISNMQRTEHYVSNDVLLDVWFAQRSLNDMEGKPIT